MRRTAIPDTELDEVERYFDLLLSMMRSRVPFEQIRARIEAAGVPAVFEALGLPFLPEDAAVWDLMAAMVDYDPRPSLERINVPMLVLFGADDQITPVAESVTVYRQAVRQELLRIEVFAGADHRVQQGDPPTLADGYLETLAVFVLAAVS